MAQGKTELNKNLGGRPSREKPAHRFALQLEDDLRPYLEHISAKQNKSPTQWINDTIRAKMEDFFNNGGTLPLKQIITDEKKPYCEGCPYYGPFEGGIVNNEPCQWIGCSIPSDIDEDEEKLLPCNMTSKAT